MVDERVWRRAASRLRLRLNLGLWLEKTLPLWVAASLLFSVLPLWERERGGEGLELLGALFALLLILSGLSRLVLLLRSRASFFTIEDALDLLDKRLGLQNRLGSADAGVGDWPEPPAVVPKAVRFRSDRAFAPLAFCAAVVALAVSIPVRVEKPPAPLPVAGPASWQEIEQALDTLREESVVQEEAIDELEERLAELRTKPREEWFDHGTLEASDTLKEELASEMRELTRALGDVASSLEELKNMDAGAPAEARRLRERRLGAALEVLDLSGLPFEREATRELQTLARNSKVRRATKEEIEKWKKMRERLYHGLPGGAEEVVVGLRSRRVGKGGKGEPGSGGVDRGPGTAPLDLSAKPRESLSDRIEGLEGDESSGGPFGATVGVSTGEHEIRTEGFRSGEDGGAVVSTGEGGDRVWTQSLLPSERRVLQRYFK
jgi:hypothetical protein